MYLNVYVSLRDRDISQLIPNVFFNAFICFLYADKLAHTKLWTELSKHHFDCCQNSCRRLASMTIWLAGQFVQFIELNEMRQQGESESSSSSRNMEDQQHDQKGSGADLLSRIALNDNKAGMEGLDRDKINKVILETSKVGTPTH